ncbi:hypothetical protein OCT63_18220 [Vibrio sp. RW]|uniref:hypothetical protein n=1 Tax=Vibrio sp. RW TaxID=2998833 RepID=UPI0022CD4BDE|nr:hypothetical protein [Vibrio sp. RW]MDA0146165.1 hypothetical protein [Vibrio sp. RW]
MSAHISDNLAIEITQEITSELRNEIDDKLVDTSGYRALIVLKSLLLHSPIRVLIAFVRITIACLLAVVLTSLYFLDAETAFELSKSSVPDLLALRDEFFSLSLTLSAIFMSFYIFFSAFRWGRKCSQEEADIRKKQDEVEYYVQLTLEVIKRVEQKKTIQLENK